MTLVRCCTCLMPTTRPDTAFIAGECSACVNYKNRPTIDWKAREGELIRILEASRNGSGFDCIVPSSGGKDSTAQVLRVIELGFRPLVVTATTCMLTKVGRKNIDNLARYATTIEYPKKGTKEYGPWRRARRKLNAIGLEMVGDVSYPEHLAIFSVPFRAAVEHGIPAIVYGENPQREYGGPLGTEEARTMTRRWVMEFGGLLGLRADDLVGMMGLTEDDMAYYRLPSDDQMQKVNACFLGQFEPWDSYRNARVAIEHGMTKRLPSKANWWDFENLDCALTGIHDHVMYRKYGYGRLCAQISVDIRNGLISRAEAYKVVRERDGLYPYFYMGVPIFATGFSAAADRFTNWEIFSHVKNGRPILKEFAEATCSAAA